MSLAVGQGYTHGKSNVLICYCAVPLVNNVNKYNTNSSIVLSASQQLPSRFWAVNKTTNYHCDCSSDWTFYNTSSHQGNGLVIHLRQNFGRQAVQEAYPNAVVNAETAVMMSWGEDFYHTAITQRESSSKMTRVLAAITAVTLALVTIYECAKRRQNEREVEQEQSVEEDDHERLYITPS